MTRKQTLIRRLHKLYDPDYALVRSLARLSVAKLETHLKCWVYQRKVWRALAPIQN